MTNSLYDNVSVPYKVEIDHQRRLVAGKWYGLIDEALCVTYIEDVWGDPIVSGYNELLDFRQASDVDLSLEALQRLVARSRSVSDPGAKARSVLVASESLIFGISRMYVSLRDLDDIHQRKWKVSGSYREALQWLGQDNVSGR